MSMISTEPLNTVDLRNRAESVLKQLQDKRLERPLFAEFAGTPKSGKSTCIEIVGHFFKRLGFRILTPTEGASKRTPYYLKQDLVAFNVWSASYALSHLFEGRYGSDGYDIAILDRGIFDALVWFQKLSGDASISKDTLYAVHRFLLIEKWRGLIDAVFLFTADVQTSLTRETQDKLIDDPGLAMNPAFLESLNKAYATVEEQYGAMFQPLFRIDTSKGRNTSPKSTAAEVVGTILGIFESRTGR